MLGQKFRLPSGPGRASAVDRLVRILSALPDKPFVLDIREHKPRRTTDQNALLWAMYAEIIKRGGEELAGWDPKDIHEYMLGEHFGWTRLSGLGRTRVKPIRRSSQLNKQEFSDLVDFVVRFMAERGIVLDMPGEMVA